MNRASWRVGFVLVWGFPHFALAGQTQDMEGSRDHPLIGRFPGSVISEYKLWHYEELDFPLGPAENNALTKAEHVGGRLTQIRYENPPNHSATEISRNYEAALKKAGFQLLFQCADQSCGSGTTHGALEDEIGWGLTGQKIATFKQPDPEVYVAIRLEGSHTWLTVLESEPMKTDQVEIVSAAILSKDIDQVGHVAVYGIYFETGKADIGAHSAATLKSIAEYLHQHPSEKLHVVGHTDNVGAFVNNLELSKKRAQAVVKALMTEYRTEAGRLVGTGVGSLTPIASNRTEEGRAKNRRVELVEQ